MAYSNFGAQFQAFVIRVANSIKELVTKTDTLTSNITTLNTNAVKTINNNKPTNGNITPAQTGCLPLGGGNVTGNLTVQSKNVVRSVNGTTADTDGNVTLTKQDIIDSLGYTPPTTNTEYTLPNATSSTLGGVKIGPNITVSSGTISLSKSNVTTALGYTPVKSLNGSTADASGNVNVSTSTRFLFDSSTVVATLSGKVTNTTKTVALEAGRLYFYCAGCKDTTDKISLSVKSDGFYIADGASLGNLSGYTHQTDSGIFLATKSTVVFTYSSTTHSGGVKIYKFNH